MTTKDGARRTISRFLYPSFREGRRSFVLAGDCSPAPATYPELVTERAAPRPLFGLAPHGVCPASGIAAAAVRSYRTFSPLPGLESFSQSQPGGIVFCGTFRETRFERIPPAVSRHAALWRPDFPPRAILFGTDGATAHPAGPVPIIGGRPRGFKVLLKIGSLCRTTGVTQKGETFQTNGVSTISWCIL
jgi:hypothetical protein